MKLLTPGHANTKIAKNGIDTRYLSYILHLAPDTLSGYKVCPMASKGCSAACLNTAGRGQFTSVQSARIKKTKRLFENRSDFLDDLFKDLTAVVNKARREKKIGVVRLNGTSDINWGAIHYQGISLFDLFKDIQFYDYTKVPVRLTREKSANYHLTFSRSETNDTDCLKLLSQGHNVAVVFKSLPDQWHGFKVINGDLNDLRFLDARGVVIGLTAKGRAKRDASGFVV